VGLRVVWTVVWTLLGSGLSASTGQIGAGTLVGAVLDSAGTPVPGALVTAINRGSQLSWTATTGNDGEFGIARVMPGVYDVRVELDGFRPLLRQRVRVLTGEATRLDLTLELGEVAELVRVTADAPVLRGESASLGHVVDNRTIVDLPLNGRNYVTLVGLAPGVALPPDSSLPRINGGRPRTNEYLFDGISVLQPEPGQVAFVPNIDAIQEFRIESNSPPAEFGRFNGGVVNLTTKSGGNQLRGTAFEFLRHEALNARNYFASASPTKPTFRRNQFGGVLGGPFRRNQTFFSPTTRASGRRLDAP